MIETEIMPILILVQGLEVAGTADEVTEQCNEIIEAVAALRDRKVQQILQDEIDEHTTHTHVDFNSRIPFPETKE